LQFESKCQFGERHFGRPICSRFLPPSVLGGREVGTDRPAAEVLHWRTELTNVSLFSKNATEGGSLRTDVSLSPLRVRGERDPCARRFRPSAAEFSSLPPIFLILSIILRSPKFVSSGHMYHGFGPSVRSSRSGEFGFPFLDDSVCSRFAAACKKSDRCEIRFI